MFHGIALRYFVEVARTGSIAAASENLHVAVSAISRQITKLEQEVGAPLFERMPRGMVLTEPGELLAQHARKTLLDSEMVIAEISAACSLGSGTVRIGCTEGFTQYLLPNLMAAMHAKQPHIRFVLHSGTPTQVEHWVAIGEVDVGITFSTASSTAISVYFSMSAPVCALMNPKHPLALKEIITLNELLAYPIAVLEKRTTVRQLIEWCCSARGMHLEPTLTTNNSSAMHQFSAQTEAITLGSRSVLNGMQGEPSLVARTIDEPLLNQRQLQVTVMKERRLPPTVECFLTALKKALA